MPASASARPASAAASTRADAPRQVQPGRRPAAARRRRRRRRRDRWPRRHPVRPAAPPRAGAGGARPGRDVVALGRRRTGRVPGLSISTGAPPSRRASARASATGCSPPAVAGPSRRVKAASCSGAPARWPSAVTTSGAVPAITSRAASRATVSVLPAPGGPTTSSGGAELPQRQLLEAQRRRQREGQRPRLQPPRQPGRHAMPGEGGRATAGPGARGGGGGSSSRSSAAVTSTPPANRRVDRISASAPSSARTCAIASAVSAARYSFSRMTGGLGLRLADPGRSPGLPVRIISSPPCGCARAGRFPPAPAPASPAGCARRSRARGSGCRRWSAAPAPRRPAPARSNTVRKRCMNSPSLDGAIASWRSSGGPISDSANAVSQSGTERDQRDIAGARRHGRR